MTKLDNDELKMISAEIAKQIGKRTLFMIAAKNFMYSQGLSRELTGQPKDNNDPYLTFQCKGRKQVVVALNSMDTYDVYVYKITKTAKLDVLHESHGVYNDMLSDILLTAFDTELPF